MRIGVVGLLRGLYLGEWAERAGITVAALCDRDPARLAAAHWRFPAARTTAGWRELLDADIDGVVLANDFDAHAPLAMAFLERGIHVLSETAACASDDEGFRLIAAAERSTATYSFAENYVLHPHVRLLRSAVPVRAAVAASLVGVAGAASLAAGFPAGAGAGCVVGGGLTGSGPRGATAGRRRAPYRGWCTRRRPRSSRCCRRIPRSWPRRAWCRAGW